MERDDKRSIAILGRAALFSGFASLEAAYRLLPGEPNLVVGAVSLFAGGAIGFTAAGVGDYFAQKVHYRRLSRQFSSAMEGVFADLREDPGTLRITDMYDYLAPALRKRLRDDEVIYPQSPKNFLVRLALGVVAVRSPENDDLLYTPLSNELLGHSLSELYELVGPFRQYQETATKLASADKNAKQRGEMGMPTNHEGIQELRARCEEQRRDVTSGFDKLVDNLASGVAKERVAQKEAEEARLLEKKIRDLKKKLQSMTKTPAYASRVCHVLHGVAFTAWAKQTPQSNELAEEHLSVFQHICEWIVAVDKLTDDFASTTGYYTTFYEEFCGTLPQLPTPEKFAEDYPEIATGLER